MSTALRSLLVAAAAGAAVALSATAASADPLPGAATEPPQSTAAAAAISTDGYDVSHPQCGTVLPVDQAFGVVGVNGGLATSANPCLADQLAWAERSSGAAAGQPEVGLYLNTANPGELRDQVSTWPTSGTTPYGNCAGGNSIACSWEYGWERAQYSVTAIFLPAAQAAGLDLQASGYRWWLDVETLNTWQSGSDGAQARNRATLEGMTAYLGALGAPVGLYSTPLQWAEIAGNVRESSSLHALPSWLAGSTTPDDARGMCSSWPLVDGGPVLLAQYVSDGLDHDVSCR